MNIHISKNVGVSGSGIYWMRSKDGKQHWCRMPIAIMGNFNTSDEYRKKHSPFEPGYQENYVEGKGNSREEALAKMAEEEKHLADSIWAV